MRENCTTLYPNEEVAQKVSIYADAHSLGLPNEVTEYHKWVLETQERSYYTISLLEARFLTWLARSIGAKRVLEIGTFVGFSAAVWADAVGPQGHVTGMEYSPKYAQLARDRLGQCSWSNIDVVEGDALEKLRALKSDKPYDIVFIDAQKSGYPTYLRTILEHSVPGETQRILRPGGIVIGDNALRSALVADASDANPATKTVPKQTENWQWSDIEKLDEFNQLMHSHERIEGVLMPMFDGLAMGRLLD